MLANQVQAKYQCVTADAEQYYKESISLLEEILKNGTDSGLRETVVCSLITIYKEIGAYDKAEQLAKAQSPVKSSREVLLAEAAEGEKEEQYRGEAMLTLLHELNCVIHQIAEVSNSPERSQAELELLLSAARMYESIFEDGSCGLFHSDLCMLYLRCESRALRLNDADAVLRYFDAAFEHYIRFRRFWTEVEKKHTEKYQYSAPLVNKVEKTNIAFVIITPQLLTSDMQSFPAELAERIRSNPKYSVLFEQ